MLPSRMLRRVALVRTDVSVLTRATRRKIPEDNILHSHRHENLKSFILSSTPGHVPPCVYMSYRLNESFVPKHKTVLAFSLWLK
jgi:hypothetical protein